MTMPIKQITAYRVTLKSERGYRRAIMATKKGAASKLAWWRIWEKYDGVDPAWLYCECIERDSYSGMQIDSVGCAIHDRDTGYLRRLHDRLTESILSGCADD